MDAVDVLMYVWVIGTVVGGLLIVIPLGAVLGATCVPSDVKALTGLGVLIYATGLVSLVLAEVIRSLRRRKLSSVSVALLSLVTKHLNRAQKVSK